MSMPLRLSLNEPGAKMIFIIFLDINNFRRFLTVNVSAHRG
jgi:hypothetical protein